MIAIRSRTALFLLITGLLFIPSQFVLLTYPSMTHAGLAGAVPTSVGPDRGREEHSQVGGCHQESIPTDKAPQNHDCCTIGHLHAVGSAPVIVAFALTVAPLHRSLFEASTHQTASHNSRLSDTGPPGSAVPIRI